ncbi:hypothetical protein BGX38DRAFT_1245533, partial [Terfezia claveryi]
MYHWSATHQGTSSCTCRASGYPVKPTSRSSTICEQSSWVECSPTRMGGVKCLGDFVRREL